MSDSIKSELSQLCGLVGNKVPTWTQGAGGNLSIKENNSLWIKATGFRLDAVKPTSGIAQVDFKKMAYVLDSANWSEAEAEQKYADLIKDTTLFGPGLGRASMETGFHARLTQKYVLHFHSLASLLFCHEFRKDPSKATQWLNSQTALKWVMIEPCRPGWILSKRVSGDAAIYFLQSHGIILQGMNSEVLQEWARIEKRFCQDFKYDELGELLISKPTFDELFKKYGTNAIPFKCYFPDVAVFVERLKAVLEKDSSGLSCFPRHAVERDRDMAELWLATQMLYRFCPQFEEVPQDIASVVRDLPTEKLRQQKEIHHG